MKNKDTFCINAFNGIRVCNDGTAMLCCMSKYQLNNADGNTINLKIDSFNDARFGKLATEIKESLASGSKHNNCQRCWDEENSGIVSKRIRDNTNHCLGDNADADTSLKIIELNLGTTCNLKCRTCGPWSSSMWNKEYIDLNLWKGSLDSYKQWTSALNHSYDPDSFFWEQFKSEISNVKEISIYGGEPLLVKKQWEILQYSVEMGYSKNQKILLNTNGTIYNQYQIDILKNFSSVHIGISVDGIESQFEYLRHPAKWEHVRENILKFNALRSHSWEVSICITLNNQNIFYLDRTLKYFQDIGMHTHLNILHEPYWFNVFCLPEHIKKIITKKYESLPSLDDHNRYWVALAVSHMNTQSGHPDGWERFLTITSQLDNFRSENFQKTFPEFYELIKSI